VSALLLCLAILSFLPSQELDPAALLRAGHFGEALERVDQELKGEPRDFRLLTMRGIALSGLGDAAAALKAYREALEIEPGYLPALEGAAQIEYKRGDGAAVRHVNELIRLHPSDAVAHAMRAELAVRSGDCGRALTDFEAALPVIRGQREALRHYGVCLVRAERFAEAESVFSDLHATGASDARAAYGLAILQIQTKEFDRALGTLAPFEGEGEALALESEAYEGLGRTPEAIEHLRSAIVAAPLREDFYAQFAELCFTYKSYQAGIDVIEAGLKQKPDSAELHVARGILLVQQGNYARADKDFAIAEQLNPREPSSADAAVLALIQANRLAEAESEVRAKLKAHPNDPQLSYFLADILNRRGARQGTPEFASSVEAAQRAVGLRPNFVLAHDLLARLYQQSGNEGGAIEESYAALKHDPEDETALYRLMRILKARRGAGDESASADLANRWKKARTKQLAAEQRASSFRIATQGEKKASDK
jgi:tetratricopeptide (TPR) repeat protein